MQDDCKQLKEEMLLKQPDKMKGGESELGRHLS